MKPQKGFKALFDKWERNAKIFFFIVIPIILVLVFFLPLKIKQHFILDLQNPTIFSAFASHFTHSKVPHLFNNLGVYLLAMSAIFNKETRKTRFYRTSVVLFLLVPFVISLLMVRYLSGLPPSQGFSAIGSGFVGYVVYAVYSFLGKRFVFNKRNLFSVLLIANFLSVSIVNGYSTGWVPLMALALVALLIKDREAVLALFEGGLDYIKGLSKGPPLDMIYAWFVMASCIVLALALPFLLPAIIVRDGSIVNTVAHYTGWIFGFLTPIALDAFNRQVNEAPGV